MKPTQPLALLPRRNAPFCFKWLGGLSLSRQEGRKLDRPTLRAIFPLLISLALVAKAAATPAYPRHPSANVRYVVDSNNVPFLIIGDAPHSILANLNNADATTYLT